MSQDGTGPFRAGSVCVILLVVDLTKLLLSISELMPAGAVQVLDR